MRARCPELRAEQPVVAVLAGGAGLRLGGAKPTVALGGKPLISYPLAAASAAGLEALVVAKRDSLLPRLRCELVLEPDEPRHPLCGMLAALRRAEGRPVIMLACDMPFVSASLLSWLAAQVGTAVVELRGRLQPLPGRYDCSAVPVFEEALRRRLPLRHAVAATAPRCIEERSLCDFGDPSLICLNVNDQTDFEQAASYLASLPLP